MDFEIIITWFLQSFSPQQTKKGGAPMHSIHPSSSAKSSAKKKLRNEPITLNCYGNKTNFP